VKSSRLGNGYDGGNRTSQSYTQSDADWIALTYELKSVTSALRHPKQPWRLDRVSRYPTIPRKYTH